MFSGLSIANGFFATGTDFIGGRKHVPSTSRLVLSSRPALSIAPGLPAIRKLRPLATKVRHGHSSPRRLRSCAKLCHAHGGELEQIQFLLGHVSVQTTERYLGCKRRISGAVNDQIGIEP